jgi:rsbT co-antagonist protein RsbR
MATYNGQTVRVSTVRDITARKRAEEEQLQLQEQVIDAQRAALRELSTPLMPLTDNVVAMPLVGAIDSARIQQIMETLLEGISDHQAEIAILDITGVQVVDTQVADGMIRAAQAVRLLGAEIVLTGIGATMAQTLVNLGADMSNITTRGTLQDGIAYAMERDQTVRQAST